MATPWIKLEGAHVHRGGKTAPSYTYETGNVRIRHTEDDLRVFFSMSSKGGGITQVEITLEPSTFAVIVNAMLETEDGVGALDPRTIVAAALRDNRADFLPHLAEIVASELRRQPEVDRKIGRDARESVYQAAARAFDEAPEGKDHAERLTRDVVRGLVDDLNRDDGPAPTPDEAQ